MVETYVKTTEEQRRSVTNSTGTDNREFYTGDNLPGDLSRVASLVSNSNSNARSNAAPRATSLRAMQSTYGNRAVQRYLRSSAPAAPARPKPSVSVQREEEGGMWDYAKKLDQIGPGIGEIVGKARSGYEWAENGILDFLGGGGESAGKGASEPEPSAGYSTDQFEPYYQIKMEDAMISGYFSGDEEGI